MIKIYGTLGPSCSNQDIIKEMFEAGMRGLRLNLSHSMLEDNISLINQVKDAAKQAGVSPEILVDLQGPELRIGTLDNDISLNVGDEFLFGENGIPLDDKILSALQKDMEILLDDGKIKAHILSNNKKNVKAIVDRGGILKSRKSIAIKDIEIDMEPLTDSDRKNISVGIELGITGIMQPFTRGKEDILTLKKVLQNEGSDSIEIFSKIENWRGINKLDEILEASDEIIIARGDLGNAVPLWELPGIQKRIANKCRNADRRFMVVTQMLSSMENSPVPTRAEVSDIFNAVLDGASSVMVTGETAVGKYPVEVIRYLKKTTESAENFR